jgi:predicted lipoprotein with Yx(FWY)xxD motif
MKSRLTLILAGSTLAALALAGCSMSATPAANSGSGGNNAPAPAKAPAKDISTADTSLGTVVIGGKGLTAYYYDNDTANSGKSSCTGSCAGLWPAITASGKTPTVSGITGKVGTITGTAGGNQVTIDGRPIYTYAGDKKAGDVTGEGVGSVWYAVSPAGKEITGAASRY